MHCQACRESKVSSRSRQLFPGTGYHLHILERFQVGIQNLRQMSTQGAAVHLLEIS